MRKVHISLQYLIFGLMLFGVFLSNKINVSASETVGEISFSVEKFTIGQGYIVEPVRLKIHKGQSVADIVLAQLKQNGYEAELDYSKGFYLSGILNADDGQYRVPAAISTMKDMVTAQGEGLTHPTGKETNKVAPDLCQYSYMSCSGWMYTVNGIFPSETMADYILKDGDIVRIQFTLYGYGGDLGSKYGDNPYADLPDRNPLTKRLALMNTYKDICFENGSRDAYNTAYNAAINLDISVTKFNAAFNALPSETEIILWVNTAAASSVEKEIRSIGTVTLNKEALISSARKSYEALNNVSKQMVSPDSVNTLEKAESAFAQLKKQKAAEEAAAKKKAEEEKALAAKQEADRKAAAAVVSQINSIGNIDLSKETAVAVARREYNALNAEAKKMVSDTVYLKLKEAEQKILFLKNKQALEKKYTPVKVVMKTPKAAVKKVNLKWKKNKTATGYQIFMSTKKTSGYKKIATIKKAKTVTFTKKKLKSKKTYYFRIRAYRKVGKQTYFGAYSTAKKVKVK